MSPSYVLRTSIRTLVVALYSEAVTAQITEETSGVISDCAWGLRLRAWSQISTWTLPGCVALGGFLTSDRDPFLIYKTRIKIYLP